MVKNGEIAPNHGRGDLWAARLQQAVQELGECWTDIKGDRGIEL